VLGERCIWKNGGVARKAAGAQKKADPWRSPSYTRNVNILYVIQYM
jgi:hypothetical protein